MVSDLEHTLQRDIARARDQLKDLLGKVNLHPRDGYLEAELAGSFEACFPSPRSRARGQK
jgi:hypothetical protein